MSTTSAPCGSLPRSMSSAGWPAMPQLVALTASATPSSASCRCSQGRTLIGAPNSPARLLARAEGAVDEPYLLHAFLRKRVAHRARAAAGPDALRALHPYANAGLQPDVVEKRAVAEFVRRADPVRAHTRDSS